MWRALAQFDPGNWAAWAGNPVWLLWGVTLGSATWAYHRRAKINSSTTPAMPRGGITGPPPGTGGEAVSG